MSVLLTRQGKHSDAADDNDIDDNIKKDVFIITWWVHACKGKSCSLPERVAEWMCDACLGNTVACPLAKIHSLLVQFSVIVTLEY